MRQPVIYNGWCYITVIYVRKIGVTLNLKLSPRAHLFSKTQGQTKGIKTYKKKKREDAQLTFSSTRTSLDKGYILTQSWKKKIAWDLIISHCVSYELFCACTKIHHSMSAK